MSSIINAAVAHLSRQKKAEDFIITEALDQRHKDRIKGMPTTRSDLVTTHDHVFGKGNDTIEIPYNREDDEKITSANQSSKIKTGGWEANHHHSSVFRHLHDKGYHVTDYVGGYARKKDEPEGREEKIGKILQKTGADKLTSPVMSNPTYKRHEKEDGTIDFTRDARGNKIVDKQPKNLSIAQAFANDPVRAAKKDVKLVVTRSKEGVGGMSTGKGWTSCMNLDTGCNRHYVPHDIQQGTLTAYMVRKGDEKTLDNPVGRINLKQFVDSDAKHHIFRPENTVYGAIPKSAQDTVKQWAETMYPHKEDAVYSKHSALYNDDGSGMIITGHPEFSKVHSNVEFHVGRMIEAHQARQEAFQDKHGEPDWNEEDEHDHVSGYLGKLPENHKHNLVIHARLHTQEDPTDKYIGQMSSDDHIGKWAYERSVPWSQIHDKDLMHHLNNAEHNSTMGHRYDHNMLLDATYTHAHLIKQALTRGTPEVKDKAISHLLENHDAPRSGEDWYGTMNDEHDQILPHLHNHTDSPALIKKLYQVGKAGTIPNLVNDFSDMTTHEQGEFAHKIGKYGDDDLITHFSRSNDYEPDSHAAIQFHKGMNERSDGEEMQHKLISEMNLGSGESNHGAIKPITDKHDMKDAINGDHSEEGIYHEGNNEMYATIAQHTKFPSVHNALKNRSDTQTDEIKTALKLNKHFS